MSGGVATQTDTAEPRRRRTSSLWTAVKSLARYLIGCLLCLSPVTSVLALGWLACFTRRAAMRRIVRLTGASPAAGPAMSLAEADAVPEWFAGRHGSRLPARLLGGLARNVAEGVATLFTLAIASIGFTLPWLLAWWAGWENSFNKGYEQSWVGPAVALAAIFFAVNVLTYLPMALAHQAVERRWRAFFDLKRVRALIANAGWRHVALAFVTVVAALPLFAANALPVFIENISPDFDPGSAEEAKRMAGLFALFAGAYAFTSLIAVRWLAARAYAHALCRAFKGNSGALWRESAAAPLLEVLPQRPRGPLRKGLFRATRLIQIVLLWVLWFGLVAQIFSAQFMNYQWWSWLTHPFFLLPWAG